MSLTDYVIMPGADYQAACDAVRAKTGKTNLIKSGDFANEINSIATNLPLGCQLKEILPKTILTFEKVETSIIPETPVAILADETEVQNMDIINNGEGGLVIWDGKIYPVYAGSRNTSLVGTGRVIFTLMGAIGNIGIPSNWYGSLVVEETQDCGASKEPFLIIANIDNGFYVAIPEDSKEFTHTLEMYKFIQTVYVTFMNGEMELLKHSVIIDHDCENVVATGVLATPTREMTVDKIFTFSGWSLTDDGTVDSSALRNIAGDRTVYAVFKEEPRPYAARFYDGDILIIEQEIGYGAQATPPNIDKEGYKLVGWTSSDGTAVTDFTITGATDFYAQWIEFVDFATASWEKISDLSKAGIAKQIFELGDTKKETLTYSDGTTEEIELQIVAFGKDTTEDGTPTITLVPKNLLSKDSGLPWTTYTLDAVAYNSTYCQIKGYLEQTVIPAMSEELRSVLQTACPTDILTYYNPPRIGARGKISLLPYYEIGLTNNGGNASSADSCLYGFDNTSASRIRTKADGSAGYWWELCLNGRNMGTSNAYWYRHCRVDTNGAFGISYSSATDREVSLLFKSCV